MHKMYKAISHIFHSLLITGTLVFPAITQARPFEDDSEAIFEEVARESPVLNLLSHGLIRGGLHEFKPIEKSNFNTSFIPTYYHEETSMSEPKKTLIVVYDVFGREAYTRAVLMDQLVINGTHLDHRLESGVYIIVGSSDQRFYKQRLAID